MRPTVPTTSGISTGDALDRRHALRGRSERIAAQAHRHGTGVSGHAGEFDVEAIASVDRSDHADRQAFAFEHRPLLDVQFRVRMDLCHGMRRIGDPGRIESERSQRSTHRDAGGICLVEQCGVERAGDGSAAQQRGTEAHALFVGETDHLDREGQPRRRRLQCVHAFDRRDDAEHAVVLPGVADGVEVRSQHQAWQTRRRSLVASDAIAHGVQPGIHSGRAHPVEHQRVRVPLLRREEHPRKAAVQFRQPPECVAPIEHTLRVERSEQGSVGDAGDDGFGGRDHGFLPEAKAFEPGFYLRPRRKECESEFQKR